MDEYNRIPDEFHIHTDEYNRDTAKQFKPRKKKRSHYKAIKCLCASSVVLLTYPVYFDVLPKAENKAVEENVVIIDDVNKNQNIDIETITDGAPATDSEPVKKILICLWKRLKP